MAICWLVNISGEGIHSVGCLRIPSSILNYVRGGRDVPTVVVWDIQTGVVINEIVIEFSPPDLPLPDRIVNEFPPPDRIEFCGNQTFVIISRLSMTLRTYDVLKGTRLSKVVVSPLRRHRLLAHWIHGESFLLAISSEIDGKSMIDVQVLQPTSSPPLLVVESFLVSHHADVVISSFSPVSFHASFLNWAGLFILDVRDSKVLLHVDTGAQRRNLRPGRFSPDGCFFACVTRGDEICVWKNTPTGYIPWSNLRPRFPPEDGEFVFSPDATSILSWGKDKNELLDNHLRPPPPNEIRPPHRRGDHLVAYSAGGTHIATAQREDGAVTIFDPLLDTQKRYIDTDMAIRDIKILDNDLFAVDEDKLVSWNLEGGAHSVKRVALDYAQATRLCANELEYIILSNDCARIALVTYGPIFLYDLITREILNEYEVGDIMDYILDVQFSPDGCQLWLSFGQENGRLGCDWVRLYTTDDWHHVNLEAGTSPEDGWSWAGHFPRGYRVRVGSMWVEDPRGRKLLWLPPDWRTKYAADAKWDGDFLALVKTSLPEPPIIKFQSQPLLSNYCSTHSSHA